MTGADLHGVPIASDPVLSAVGVVTALAISSSAVDVSPVSTSGALLLASAQPKDERLFFRALILCAVAMIVVVPVLVWFIFVQLGIWTANRWPGRRRQRHCRLV